MNNSASAPIRSGAESQMMAAITSIEIGSEPVVDPPDDAPQAETVASEAREMVKKDLGITVKR